MKQRRKRRLQRVRAAIFGWPDCRVCGEGVNLRKPHGWVTTDRTTSGQFKEATSEAICIDCTVERQREAERMIEDDGRIMLTYHSHSGVLHQFPFAPAL